MVTLDLRRSIRPTVTDGRLRFELDEDRRESSFWMPAFIVAEAAREREDERGDGELVGGRCCWRGVPEGDRDGGKELRSGAIL